MGAVNNSFASNYILGMANLVFPEYVIQRWHTVLVAWCVGVIALGVNVFAPHLLHRISRLILLWNISTFVIIIATLLATNNHKQDASFVFHDFQNMTGFAKPMAVMVGIVQPLFGMCCYDAASHMSEEMNRPSRDAPKAIILSVLLGAGTGFVFLITVCFCISDIEGAQTTSTGVPIIQVLYESTRSKPAACILTGMITVITIVTSVSLTAEGSRSVYAFARDRGLPFSSHLSKVNPRMKIPVLALLLTLTIQVALNAIYFGTSTGFNTVVSIASTGFCKSFHLHYRPLHHRLTRYQDISYGLALFARLLGYFENKWTLSTYTHTHTHTNTYKYAYALPLPLSLSFNALGLLFLVFAIIVFNFPSESPVDSESMNYTCAAVALVGCLSAVTWFTSARFRFSEPVVSTGALDGEDGEDGGRGSLSAADLGGGDVKFKGG